MSRNENYKNFVKYVKNMRRMMPTELNGRNVVVTHEFTAKGFELRSQHQNSYKGHDLSDVYKTWSDKKQSAYDDVWSIFCDTIGGRNFGIRSANSFGFTVSFETRNMIVFYTPKTEYIVFLANY